MDLIRFVTQEFDSGVTLGETHEFSLKERKTNINGKKFSDWFLIKLIKKKLGKFVIKKFYHFL